MKNNPISKPKNFNTDLIFRNLIYVVIYIGAISIYFSYALWPQIMAFKTQYLLETKQKIIHNEIREGFRESRVRVLDYKEEHKKLLERLNNKNPALAIKESLTKYLSIKGVKKISENNDQKEYIKTTIYAINAQTDDIHKFWKLLSDLGELNASVIVMLPVKIQKASMQAKIYDITFNIEVAQNTYKPTKQLEEMLRGLGGNQPN